MAGSLGIVGIVLICVWGSMTYRINKAYPNPENIPVKLGERTKFHGAFLTGESAEVLSPEEMLENYPQLTDTYEIMGEEISKEMLQDFQQYNYMLVKVKLVNGTDCDINFGKNGDALYWIFEEGRESNAQEMFLFQTLNPEYSGSGIKANSEQEVILVSSIMKMYQSLEELKKQEIKVVYSYYPTKNYISILPEERIS